jgi:homoserine kinase
MVVQAMKDTKSQKNNVSRSATVRVPGATSNLGPGFDSLGLAMNVYNTVTFDLLDADDKSVPLITLSERTYQKLPRDASNQIFQLFAAQLGEHSPILSRVRIHIDCTVPIGAGLGSSGAAALAALWGADALLGRQYDEKQLLRKAVAIEGHPDNVSPSLLGGFTVSAVAKNQDVLVKKLRWPDEWRPIFVVPARELSTKHARSVLPRMVPRMDAVHNVQRVALLIAAVSAQDETLLSEAFDDKLHEPYRASLVPELSELRKLTRGGDAYGCVLSGAGPTCMILTHRRHLNTISHSLEDWAEAQKERPTILQLAVDNEGLKQVDE